VSELERDRGRERERERATHGTREKTRCTTHGKDFSWVGERPESSGPSFAQATCSGSCIPEPKNHGSGVSMLFTCTMHGWWGARF